MTTSIMIVGVGGQGTLLASKLLGNVLIARGYDVKLSEVHGMSQRGPEKRDLGGHGHQRRQRGHDRHGDHHLEPPSPVRGPAGGL